MANQQGKKTQAGQPANTGDGAATGGPSTSPQPAGWQDQPRNEMKTSATAGQTSTQPTAPGNGPFSQPAVSKLSGPQGVSDPASTSADQPVSEKLSSTANDILDKAKETASGTYDAVSTKATEKIEARKGELSSGLKTLADTFRKTGTDLESTEQTTPLTDVAARYTGTAARQIENIANYFERKDLKAMMRDAEGFARRNPAIFLGAAFGLGMLAARFLKSSPNNGRGTIETRGINADLPTGLSSGNRTGTNMPTNP